MDLAKRFENLEHAAALHSMTTLVAFINATGTPAIEDGISDHVWSLEEIAGLIVEPVATKYDKDKINK